MITYFNRRTGDTAQYGKPNTRLDALDNWVRLREGDPLPAVESDGVLSRPSLHTETPVRAQATSDSSDPDEDSDSDPAEVPDQDASLGDWQAYAMRVADDPDALADVEYLSREELIAAYGPGAGGDAGPDAPTPSESAPVAEWRAWVVANKVDNDPAVHAEIAKATKADLIRQYGGDA